jgi:hypothetical protein
LLPHPFSHLSLTHHTYLLHASSMSPATDHHTPYHSTPLPPHLATTPAAVVPAITGSVPQQRVGPPLEDWGHAGATSLLPDHACHARVLMSSYLYVYVGMRACRRVLGGGASPLPHGAAVAKASASASRMPVKRVCVLLVCMLAVCAWAWVRVYSLSCVCIYVCGAGAAHAAPGAQPLGGPAPGVRAAYLAAGTTSCTQTASTSQLTCTEVSCAPRARESNTAPTQRHSPPSLRNGSTTPPPSPLPFSSPPSPHIHTRVAPLPTSTTTTHTHRPPHTFLLPPPPAPSTCSCTRTRWTGTPCL